MPGGNGEGWARKRSWLVSPPPAPDDTAVFIRRFAGNGAVSFLVEEVLEHQPERMVAFLKATSVVDEFDVELANFLLSGGAHVKSYSAEAVMLACSFPPMPVPLPLPPAVSRASSTPCWRTIRSFAPGAALVCRHLVQEGRRRARR